MSYFGKKKLFMYYFIEILETSDQLIISYSF